MSLLDQSLRLLAKLFCSVLFVVAIIMIIALADKPIVTTKDLKLSLWAQNMTKLS